MTQNQYLNAVANPVLKPSKGLGKEFGDEAKRFQANHGPIGYQSWVAKNVKAESG